MSKVINQWAPRPGVLRRAEPTTNDSWSPDASPVALYLLHLRSLGLEDQTDYLDRSATDHYRHAIFLRDQTVSVVATPDEREAITKRLALGEITPEEAQKRLAKSAPKVNDAQDLANGTRKTISDATREAYSFAVTAIRGYHWLTPLRVLVADAVAAQDDARFDALHRFAALLRSPGLAALAMVAGDGSGIREFDETWRYKVSRPDLYHAWRLARAERTHTVAHVTAGTLVFVAAAVTKGPHPTLADMVEGEMEPSLLSAAEVVSITEAILAEQEAAQSAEPVPSRRSRAGVAS